MYAPKASAGRQHLRLGGLRGEALEHVVGPAQQLGPVLGAHAERVADHDHRERRGDVAHEVGAAVVDHRVEDLGARLAHLRLAVPHAARGEPLVHELAALQVGGVVHVDHVGSGPCWGRMPPALEKSSVRCDTSFTSA